MWKKIKSLFSLRNIFILFLVLAILWLCYDARRESKCRTNDNNTTKQINELENHIEKSERENQSAQHSTESVIERAEQAAADNQRIKDVIKSSQQLIDEIRTDNQRAEQLIDEIVKGSERREEKNR